MMSRDRHSQYRGSKVTVRCAETKSESSRACVYVASYMLTSEDGKQSSWRHFHALKFHTSDTAVAYALREAHRSLDGERPAHPKDGTNGSAPH
jgi:hypothetical protein